MEPSDDAPDDRIPARMVSEVVYCPWLFRLEHVAEEWDDNADSVSGKRTHRRDHKRPTTPITGFRLRFAEPVTGPIVLGWGCHYGLGAFEPDEDFATAATPG